MAFGGSSPSNPAAVDRKDGPIVIVAASPEQVASVKEIGGVLNRDVRVRDSTVAALSVRRELPSVVLVGLRDGPTIALDVIEATVRPSMCPVIALVDERVPPAYIDEAVKRGVATCTADITLDGLLGSLQLATGRKNDDYLELVAALAVRVEAELAYDVHLNRRRLPAAP